MINGDPIRDDLHRIVAKYTDDWEIQRMAQCLISLLDTVEGTQEATIPTHWVRQIINRFLWRDV